MREIINGAVEHLVVGDGNDAAGNWRLWTHIDGGSLCSIGDWPISMMRVCMKDKPMTSPRAPPIESVADVEGLAAKDDEIPGNRRDHPLESEGHAGPDQADDACEPRGIVEPDRQDPKEQDCRDDEADPLPGPELSAGAGTAADKQLEDLTSAQAKTHATTINAIISSSLCRLCEVAPMRVTPNTRAPST